MSKDFYKQVILSQLIISGWILYGFFDYLTGDDEMGFAKLSLFFYLLGSCMWVSGIGLILALLRLTWFRKERKQLLNKTFIYVFAGIFNSYLVLIWIVTAIFELVKFEDYLSFGYMFAALFPTIIILKDFYRSGSKKTPYPITASE